MANDDKKSLLFSSTPEVSHTEEGSKMLENFVLNICQSERSWKLTNYIERTVAEIKEKVGSQKVILGLSGGARFICSSSYLSIKLSEIS